MFLQDLNSRASSEIVIRQALAELDMWEVEAKLQFMTQRDSKGREIFLIKDFKDILSKVNLKFYYRLEHLHFKD